MNHTKLLQPVRWASQHNLWGSIVIVLIISQVIALQVSDRRNFANSELYRDVIERWGAPIVQPVPSVRFVPSGSIFTRLQSLPIEQQYVRVDARMNYRKRGLVYFSGFDFAFDATYRVRNTETANIDVVFVFPVDLERNKVMLSDLTFSVNDQPARVDLASESATLAWTGRMEPGQEAVFAIRFRGRGLDSFVYQLDPELPVRGFVLEMNVEGGLNYDYPLGAAPAMAITARGDRISMRWEFSSLESGVPVGVILPSERSFDRWIVTMVTHAWAPCIGFVGALAVLAQQRRRRFLWYQSYLIAAAYGFFFVLLAYLAAFMNFYVAYAIATAVTALLVFFYVGQLLSPSAGRLAVILLAGGLTVPTLAVMAEGYTGLIYALEILAALAVLMRLTTQAAFQDLIAQAFPPTPESGVANG